MIQDHSYGIIPLQKQGGNWMVLLIQHSSAGYWGFPKGHPDNEELPIEAAIRELKEETNLDVIAFFSEAMLEEHYHFTLHGKHINKTVGYFVAEVGGDLTLQQIEISGAKWVEIDDAFNQLTYDNDKAILKQAKSILEKR